jgi:hypothetical protein
MPAPSSTLELEGELSRLRIVEFVVAMRASALASLPRRLLLPLPLPLPLPLTVPVSSRAGGPYRL